MRVRGSALVPLAYDAFVVVNAIKMNQDNVRVFVLVHSFRCSNVSNGFASCFADSH